MPPVFAQLGARRMVVQGHHKLLCHVVRGYCELYDLAAPSPSGGDRAERAERFVEDLDRFCREVGVPRSLEDFGVDQDSPPLIMEHLSALWAAVELNPVDMTAEDVEEILRALLKQRP
jgi:alcohol dehydrogenase class IV